MYRTWLFIFLFLPALVFAGENFFEAGIAYLYQENNLAVDSDNEKISSYSDPDDGFSKITPIVSFSYNFDKYYIKSSPLSTEGGGIQAGATFSDLLYSDLTIFAVYNLPTKVWKNPYELNTDRSHTYKNSYGLGARLEEIVDSAFSYEIKVQMDDVRSDEVGTLYDDLERDGYVISQKLYRKFGLNEHLFLNLGVTYSKGLYDGDANSYDKIGLLGRLSFNKKEYSAQLIYFFGYSKFDENHPIFGDTREDTGGSILLSVRKNNILGNENVFASIYCGAGIGKSNIDFYEKRFEFIGMGVGYSF
ncbi:DUF2860 family protein [Flexistipes sinusarabici]|uniref:DUF2860 family protein n=1 Tax=Flexistipes sinusarabici TaxID=2352 RepID=UPI002352384F|nr:DUF2860 family protein [Flexistipes sinusarabici]